MAKIIERYSIKNVSYKGKHYQNLGAFVYADDQDHEHIVLDFSGHSADILDKLFREDLRIKYLQERLEQRTGSKIICYFDSNDNIVYYLELKTPQGIKYIVYDDSMKCTGTYCDFDSHKHSRYYPPLHPLKNLPNEIRDRHRRLYTK